MSYKTVEVEVSEGKKISLSGLVEEDRVYVERADLGCHLTNDIALDIATAFNTEIVRMVSSIEGRHEERSTFECRPFESN